MVRATSIYCKIQEEAFALAAIRAWDKTERIGHPVIRSQQRSRKVLLLCLVVAAASLGYARQPLADRFIEHRYYETSDKTAIATWAVKLPGRYRLLRQQSLPVAGQDGWRLFRIDRP